MQRLENTKHGYMLTEESTDAMFREVCDTYDKVNCVICNAKTATCFGPRSFLFNTKSIVTINNKVPDGVFYINYIF